MKCRCKTRSEDRKEVLLEHVRVRMNLISGRMSLFSSAETKCRQDRAAVYPWKCISMSFPCSYHMKKFWSGSTQPAFNAAQISHVGFLLHGLGRIQLFVFTEDTRVCDQSRVISRFDYNLILARLRSTERRMTCFRYPSSDPVAGFIGFHVQFKTLMLA